MKRYSLSHLSNEELRSGLYKSLAAERGVTADVLAHVAEFDERKLYAPESYPSMFAYCVGAMHLSEDAAYKRIQAARAARKFPAIFDAIADGRLHLTGVVRLAPHLTPETAGELLTAATHNSKAQIELLLAERFPQPDLPTRLLAPIPVADACAPEHAAAASGTFAAESIPAPAARLVTEPVSHGGMAPAGSIAPPEPRAKMAPLSPGRFGLQVTLAQRTHDRIREALDLLGNRIASGDIAYVIDQAMGLYVAELRREKFAATSRPQTTPRRSKPGTRHIPAHVKRAVYRRDDGQCAFVSVSGRRCEARTRLEFHHVTEFARGGEATVDGIQLRCRVHNQYEAERIFGTEFMRHKREENRRTRAAAREG